MQVFVCSAFFVPDKPKLGQVCRRRLENFTRFKYACVHHNTQDVHKASMVKFGNFKAFAQVYWFIAVTIFWL